MMRVAAPSRLHFGLLRLPLKGGDGAGRRLFGGVGMMIDQPGVQVTVLRSATWSATGPLAHRALEAARRFAENTPETRGQAFEIIVNRCAPEHAGLGTGTQLSLAVARAVALTLGLDDLGYTELPRRVGRGLRSGIGVHGFFFGGLMVDGGKTTPNSLAAIVHRHDFPDEWRIVVAVPADIRGAHGLGEVSAFERLASLPDSAPATDALCRLTLLGILPALVERDLQSFGEALYEFNRKAGEMFAPVQGGVYAQGKIEAMVEFLRERGVRGAGQSSWGPAVFAMVAADEGPRILESLKNRFVLTGDQAFVAKGENRGHVEAIQ